MRRFLNLKCNFSLTTGMIWLLSIQSFFYCKEINLVLYELITWQHTDMNELLSLMAQIMSLEAVLAGALRRELVAELSAKKSVAEIGHLTCLVREWTPSSNVQQAVNKLHSSHMSDMGVRHWIVAVAYIEVPRVMAYPCPSVSISESLSPTIEQFNTSTINTSA